MLAEPLSVKRGARKGGHPKAQDTRDAMCVMMGPRRGIVAMSAVAVQLAL